MAPSESHASKLRSIPWSVMSRINTTLTLTFDLVSAPGHMNTLSTCYLGPHLNPAFQSIHLFGLSSKNMRYMMNYLSFTSYNGWRKIQLIEKWKQKEKQKHKKETNWEVWGKSSSFSLASFSNYCVQSLSPCWSFLCFWLCSCKAFGVFSLWRKYREQRQHCASKNSSCCNSYIQ